jgi:outer membrane protein assembly factor BamA
VRLRTFLLCCLTTLLFTATLRAQTYTPAKIMILAGPGADTAQILGITGLKQGVPLTKQEIEAAMQRLADSGAFSDLSYVVNSTALTVTLKPVASSQSLPVRYGNFPWWSQAQLESLVEARVPLFHGQVPDHGTLTDQVSAALAALVEEQHGLSVTVDASAEAAGMGGPLTTIVFRIEQPPVLLHEVQLTGVPAGLSSLTAEVQHAVNDSDFDTTQTPIELRQTAQQQFQRAGYLDAEAAMPVVASPLVEGGRILINASVPLEVGSLYRVSGVSITVAPMAAPQVNERTLQSAAGVKPGSTATFVLQREAQNRLAHEYKAAGYLDAEANFVATKEAAGRTVAWTFTMVPGEIYHAGAVSAAGLDTATRSRFEAAWKSSAGEVFDSAFFLRLQQTLAGLHSPRQIVIGIASSRETHTASVSLEYAK